MIPAFRAAAVHALARRLALSSQPILLGPWRSEVGFEGLYWRPFLQWLAARVPHFWQRAVVISRGGGVGLYGSAASTTPTEDNPFPVAGWACPAHVDLYALRSVAEVRRQNLYDQSITGLQKQTRVTAWDRQVWHDVADQLGLRRYQVVHPAWMYWALAPFWDEDRGLKYLLGLTDYAPIPVPPPPVTLEGLPEKYVAVKFYGRPTWPHPHPETTAFVAHVVGTVSQQVPVVLLNSGHDGDEHTDMRVTGPNIFTMPPVPPEHNLGTQLAILGRAQAFLGTYGGVAQVALRMKVPSLSVWAQFGATAHAHLSLSSYLSKATNVPFVAGSLADGSLWQQALMVVKQAQKVEPIPAEVEGVPA